MMLSPHIALAIAHAVHVGHRPGDPPPLATGQSVSGCSCPDCTGVPTDHPARRSLHRKKRRRELDPLPVDDARAVPLLEVAERLGLGEPRRVGKEYVLPCPLHDDSRPSLRLNAERGLWHCFPCGEGGDGIELWMRVRGVTFADAVRELAG